MTIYLVSENGQFNYSEKLKEFLISPCLLNNRMSVWRIIRSLNNYILNSDSEAERLAILTNLYNLILHHFRILHTDILFIQQLIRRLEPIECDYWKEETMKRLHKLLN